MGEPTRRLRVRALECAVATVVLALAAALAATGLPRWEATAFEALAELPVAVSGALWLPMQLGTVFASVAVGSVAWMTLARWRPALGVIVAGLAAWLLAGMVKDAVGRSRPAGLLEGFTPKLDAPVDGLGFPSGHAAVAFAIAGVLSPYLGRRWRIGVWVAAGAVAVARVTVGAHFPLDVVGGAALGLMVASAWHLAVGEPSSGPERSSGSAPSGNHRPGRQTSA